MNKVNRYLKVILIIMAVLGFSGCNNMNASMDNIKYGKLYTMLEALDNAAQNCTDETARLRAVEWIVIGYHDLDNSRSYMDKRSHQYQSTRSLMRSLSTISSRRISNVEKLCHNIEVAGQITREYLTSLDKPELIADETIELAVVQY